MTEEEKRAEYLFLQYAQFMKQIWIPHFFRFYWHHYFLDKMHHEVFGWE